MSLNISTIAISPEEFQRLQKNDERMLHLSQEVDRLNSKAFEHSIKYQQQRTEIVELTTANKKLSLQKETLTKLLIPFLEDFEGNWDGHCDYETGQHYIECATWIKRHTGRVHNIIHEVQQHINKYVPEELQIP